MYNKWTGVGRVQKINDRGTFLSFSIPTETYSGKNEDGTWKKTVQWHNCAINGKNKENFVKYVQNNDIIFVEAEVRYKEKDGKMFTTMFVKQFIKATTKDNDNTSAEAPKTVKMSAKPDLQNRDDDDLPF